MTSDLLKNHKLKKLTCTQDEVIHAEAERRPVEERGLYPVSADASASLRCSLSAPILTEDARSWGEKNLPESGKVLR